MRGTTLNVLVQLLRRELRVAESPALGKNSHESYCHALRSAQDRLFTEHDWPFKKIKRDITLQAGARYYNPPADLDLENIRSANCYYNERWLPVERGIAYEDRNTYDAENDDRSDPVLKWDLHNDQATNSDMVEVFPLPLTNDLIVRFDGQRKLRPLLANNDKCDLDDLLIVLTAAADLVPAKDATRARQKADRHLFGLRRNLSNNKMFVSGGGSDPTAEKQYQPRVIIVPSGSGG